MKSPIIKPKWIIVGFNIGIGIAIVYFSVVLFFPIGLFILVALALLIFIPAFAGKTLAQLINRFR